MSTLKETLKTFSSIPSFFSRTNIVDPGGYSALNFGSKSVQSQRSKKTTMAPLNPKFLTDYFKTFDDLREYESSEIGVIATGAITDYIKNYINYNDPIINIKNESLRGWAEKINKILDQHLKIRDELSNNIDPIVYYGSYCFKINWDEEARKFKKAALAHPNSVVSVYRGGKLDSYLVISRNGNVAIVEPDKILRIGAPDYYLINDTGQNLYLEQDKKKAEKAQEKDTILDDSKIAAGSPLFINVLPKIKEYLLKEQLISLIGIKDLITPMILLLSVDKNTAPDDANELALNVENLFNKYSDVSTIYSQSFSINSLSDAILNNIRVFPDYNSASSSMQEAMQMNKMAEKIQMIRQEQDFLKENILRAIGIPSVLYSGDTTKWEAIKMSERLNSKVSSLIKRINDSIFSIIETISKQVFPDIHFERSDIEINIFNKTQVEFNSIINSCEMAGQVLSSVNQLIDMLSQEMQQETVDREKYFDYVKSLIQQADPSAVEIIRMPPDQPPMDEEQQMQGGGYGGYN